MDRKRLYRLDFFSFSYNLSPITSYPFCMSLAREEVQHIANLARLALTEEEEVLFANQLSSILDYVAQLQKIDTSGVVYAYQVEGLKNVKALDEVSASDEQTRKRILEAMPDRAEDFLRTKGIFS